HGHNLTILRGVLEAMQARGLVGRRPD
ncbi:polysaccharide deacetylase family protein, partial [Xanthomonas perforans]|nr:polysaccharide deacetylase family protein [Xanthomonas perforans]